MHLMPSKQVNPSDDTHNGVYKENSVLRLEQLWAVC